MCVCLYIVSVRCACIVYIYAMRNMKRMCYPHTNTNTHHTQYTCIHMTVRNKNRFMHWFIYLLLSVISIFLDTILWCVRNKRAKYIIAAAFTTTKKSYRMPIAYDCFDWTTHTGKYCSANATALQFIQYNAVDKIECISKVSNVFCCHFVCVIYFFPPLSSARYHIKLWHAVGECSSKFPFHLSFLQRQQQ